MSVGKPIKPVTRALSPCAPAPERAPPEFFGLPIATSSARPAQVKPFFGRPPQEVTPSPQRMIAGNRIPSRSQWKENGSGDCPVRPLAVYRAHPICEGIDWHDSTRSRHPSAGMATARWVLGYSVSLMQQL